MLGFRDPFIPRIRGGVRFHDSASIKGSWKAKGAQWQFVPNKLPFDEVLCSAGWIPIGAHGLNIPTSTHFYNIFLLHFPPLLIPGKTVGSRNQETGLVQNFGADQRKRPTGNGGNI